MRLYLDDDIVSAALIQVLTGAGHDVRLPADLGLRGKHDAVHLIQAIRESRLCLSRNYDDFEELHILVGDSKGHHSGIVIVRRDNDPKRNMSPRDIVRALAKL